MKILHIKPKKILQWNFFALPPNSEKNNSKVAGLKSQNKNFRYFKKLF